MIVGGVRADMGLAEGDREIVESHGRRNCWLRDSEAALQSFEMNRGLGSGNKLPISVPLLTLRAAVSKEAGSLQRRIDNGDEGIRAIDYSVHV